MKLRVDHVTVCGSELDAMRAAFGDVGLTTHYGGPHANGATHMALRGFDDGSYIELIAPIAKSGGASGMMGGWAAWMNGDAGTGAWAVESTDIHQEVKRLETAGIDVRGPEPGSRVRPDGIALLWKTAMVGSGAAGAVLPFLIQDITPRELRLTRSSEKDASGLTGVGAVVLGVWEVAETAALFCSAYGWGVLLKEKHGDFGATVSHFAGTPVMLAAPIEENSWLRERLQRFGECPAAFLLGTDDFARAKERFALTHEATWFGRKVAWFDQRRLRGTRVGVIA
jgi:hypothetical protein